MVREGVLAMAMAMAAAGIGGGGSGQHALDRGRATFADGTVVSLEIADTDEKRQRGLMFRETLAEREGMIFIFDAPGFYPFWMRNCRIALDILWLDDRFRITSLAESVPPCRLPGCEPPCSSMECPQVAPAAGTTAKYVVEVASGFAKRHGVRAGQALPVQLPAR
jgi:uncharacterized protein